MFQVLVFCVHYVTSRHNSNCLYTVIVCEACPFKDCVMVFLNMFTVSVIVYLHPLQHVHFETAFYSL